MAFFSLRLPGGVVIPDLVTVLGKDRKRARSAIIIGTLIPAALYFLFAFAVVGALGGTVSKEAIQGLRGVAGQNLVLFGSVVGFLAVFTSFIVLNTSFQALLRLDFGVSRALAWLSASSIPFLLYLLGIQNFLLVIGVVGAVAVGIDSALVLAAHYRLRKQEGASFTWISYLWRVAVYGMIVGGVIYEFLKIVR